MFFYRMAVIMLIQLGEAKAYFLNKLASSATMVHYIKFDEHEF